MSVNVINRTTFIIEISFNFFYVKIIFCCILQEQQQVPTKVRIMAFNASFNNSLWRSVLFVEETGVPGENHRPAASL